MSECVLQADTANNWVCVCVFMANMLYWLIFYLDVTIADM